MSDNVGDAFDVFKSILRKTPYSRHVSISMNTKARVPHLGLDYTAQGNYGHWNFRTQGETNHPISVKFGKCHIKRGQNNTAKTWWHHAHRTAQLPDEQVEWFIDE